MAFDGDWWTKWTWHKFFLSDFALSFFLLPLSLVKTWLIQIVSIELALSSLKDLACFDRLCCEVLVKHLDA